MDETSTRNGYELRTDFRRVFPAVWKKGWLIVLTAAVCAAAALLISCFFMTPRYQATAKFYVNNRNSTFSGITSSDLTTSRNLVDSYIAILNTRESLNEVIAYAGLSLSSTELQEMISAEAVGDTELFVVTVTGPVPEETAAIANAVASVLPNRIANIIEGTSTKVVETAVVPGSPSAPSHVKNTAIGCLLGFFLAAGLVVLREIFDVTIRTEEDIARSCSYPVLAAVPDMNAQDGGGSFGRTERPEQLDPGNQGQPDALVGEGISFAASEAYKTLRTKLQFSFADEQSCRVIGHSSPLSDEGKSLTCANLAYALAQLGKKVILIDADMRRPTLATKLGLKKYPGLSNYLTGQAQFAELIQICNTGPAKPFHVITAGRNPPNPMELLSSKKMQKTLGVLRNNYDYILLDLPPVGEVSDALAVAKETDGILLVVRQNYCNDMALKDTVRQLEFVNARILGTVFNCAAENGGRYGRAYYKKYQPGSDKTPQRKVRFPIRLPGKTAAKTHGE